MFTLILLSLGTLLSSAPGLGGPTYPFEAGGPHLGASLSVPLWHSAPSQGLPSPASREETNLSDPKEKEEESEHFLLGCTARPGDRVLAIGEGDGALGRLLPTDGFLHQLHHSWQLRC
jgi:hypothetical protein